MKKNIRVIILIILFFALGITSIATISYSAYFGRGVFKDVFVNKKYYFGSDSLKEVSSIEKASENRTSTISTIYNVNIYNFNQTSGDFDDFDIVYDVYAWVSEATKTYKVEINGTRYDVSTTNHDTPIKSGLILQKNQQSTGFIGIDFNIAGVVDYDTLPYINIAVVATTPSYLPNKMLAASFELKKNDVFSTLCYLEYDDSASTTDYAGFKYVISMVGEPRIGDRLVIKWNSSALTLSAIPNNMLVNPQIEDLVSDPSGYDKSLSFDAVTNFKTTLTFFRSEVDDELSSYWVDEASWENAWEKVEGLISYELVSQ